MFESNNLKLAMKDEKSCLIASKKGEIMLIDKDLLISDSTFWPHWVKNPREELQDIVYCDEQKAYIIKINDLLYKKDISERPPLLFMRILSSSRISGAVKYLRYSRQLQHLFCLSRSRLSKRSKEVSCKILMINVKRKKISASLI